MTSFNVDNHGDDPETLLESGCSLREQAHEDDFQQVKLDLHQAPEWNNFVHSQNDTTTIPSIPESAPPKDSATFSVESILSSDAFQSIRDHVVADMIGHEQSFHSALEWKAGSPLKVPLVYCDFTASSRPIGSIEEYLQTTCVPFYGNTHTNTSITGSQSSAFVSEARQIIAEACNAKISGKASQDVVLFAGNGTTASVHLLIDCLGLKHFHQHDDNTKNADKPLVILGPFEHHSNMLPWRELGTVDIETVAYQNGTIDLKDLERILKRHEKRNSIKIGSFAAASNLTGTVVDDLAITALLHQYGALSVWDYATGASYLDMNMNPTMPNVSGDSVAAFAKDAIFFSGHKLLGGVGTPGVLIIKKRLVSTLNPPENCGGGTVFYVTQDHHRFLSNRMERYEGGTPNVMGIWRLGLAFRYKLSLKASVAKVAAALGYQRVSPMGPYSLLPSFDIERAKNIQKRLKEIPNVVLLDGHAPEDIPKVPIFSFLVKCGRRFLHYNYVCALLNDLFGIQSRGGCQCAGPYAQLLLGMTQVNNERFQSNKAVEDWLVRTKDELLRPGATRLSLPALGTSQHQEEYVIQAIQWVARNGWKMMHVYRCNHRSGEWRHMSRPGAPLGSRGDRIWLSQFRLKAINPREEESNPKATESPISLVDALTNANSILEIVLNDQSSIAQALKMVGEEEMDSPLRWYVYPKDVARYVCDRADDVPGTFEPTDIQGAIHPLASKPCHSIASHDEVSDMISLAPPEDIGSERVDLSIGMHFRDGEHSGEAPLEEIVAGFEDGELSELCQVFDVALDEWVTISSFIDRLGISKPSETTPAQMPSENGTNEETDDRRVEADDTHHSERAVPYYHDDDDDATALLNKNDKKKPARDSSSWGKGEVQSIDAMKTKVGESSPVLDARKTMALRTKKVGHVQPPPKLMRTVTQAIVQWDMLEDGDRLLLGLSGGKDSLSLLHVLLEFQRKLPIRFDIEVCTIDPMTPSFDPSPLIPYVEGLGLKYHYIQDDIVERASSAGKDGKLVSSLCAYCARMKRGNLYACARANNCNKLVLAQHLDDLAESFMMSVMHNGFLRTMKANYRINAGDLSVIRPLAYCREALMTDFARKANLPIINENCPACFEEPKERARMKKLLAKEETLYPNFYDNIKRAIMPLLHDDATAILRSYTDEALAKTRREGKGKRASGRYTSTADRPEEPIHSMSLNSDSMSRRSLESATEEELIRELARRRAQRCRLAGAMAPRTQEPREDPTGQVCSLNGGNGTIPCYELME
ncbi:aminotransferase [Nitzschia inconspicua]|uniref:Aminotransferase n=1 Tax=Nitzschia inconspicua TaxID=303405 RepID=A0A9K3PRA9_9STRA|nr:aminotransferase [Nitzschia inconspicua]